MKHLFFFFGLFYSFSCLSQQDVDFDEITSYLNTMQKDWDIPGMAVGIVKDGELVYAKGFGIIEEGKREKPNQHTNYAIASNSKAFTTALIATLVQEGKLKWEDKVVDYLPYFEIYDPYITQLVTIEDLLSHRVGLGTFSGDVMWYDNNLTTEEVVRRAKYIPQAYEFRDGYGYSNVMYITAGAIIEKVTGKSWCKNITERFLAPLGMDRTYCELNKAKADENIATPHATVDDKNKIIRWENWDHVASTGGIISNIEDLSKWVIFNLNHGIHGKDTILTAASRNKIWTPHNTFTVNHTTDNLNSPDFSGYGLGFGLSEYKGHFRVSHTGGYGGMLSSIYMLPDEKLAVIMLSNDTQSPILAVPYYIFDRYVDPTSTTDYSKNMLRSLRKRKLNDKRVQSIKNKRVPNTTPSKSLKDYEGNYYSDLYGGNLSIKEKNGVLHLEFEHSPTLNATLSHWHYDTFQLHWNQLQPWFGFGIMQFKMSPTHEIIGLDFNVPNDDFFFEEFKAYKMK